MDYPVFDPLWGDEGANKYLYISHRYQNREDYVACEYREKRMNQISAIIPRLAIDFPYMREEKARNLKFEHEYLLDTYEKVSFLRKIRV